MVERSSWEQHADSNGVRCARDRLQFDFATEKSRSAGMKKEASLLISSHFRSGGLCSCSMYNALSPSPTHGGASRPDFDSISRCRLLDWDLWCLCFMLCVGVSGIVLVLVRCNSQNVSWSTCSVLIRRWQLQSIESHLQAIIALAPALIAYSTMRPAA